MKACQPATVNQPVDYDELGVMIIGQLRCYIPVT